MYVEKVKGPSRREEKLIKDWEEIENSASIPAVKSMRDFFAHRWRRLHGGESNMKVPVRKKTGVYTWCTPWLCLWIMGVFPFFSHSKWSWKCFPIPGCESLTVFVSTISLTAKEGQTAALQPQPGRFPKTSLEPLLIQASSCGFAASWAVVK